MSHHFLFSEKVQDEEESGDKAKEKDKEGTNKNQEMKLLFMHNYTCMCHKFAEIKEQDEGMCIISNYAAIIYY